MLYPDEFSKLFNDGMVLFKEQLNGREIETCRELYSYWFRSIPGEYLKSVKTCWIKDYFNGHQSFSWYIRCLFNVNVLFTEYWGVHDLVVSYERSIRFDNSGRDEVMYTNWVHDPRYGGRSGVRAYVVVSAPEGTCFVHLPGKWGMKNGNGKVRVERSEGAFTPIKAGDIVLFSASLVTCLAFGNGVTVIQPVSYYPRSKITPNVSYKRFHMYLSNDVSSHGCHNFISLEKGDFEKRTIPNDMDQFLDLIYVDHEIRNTLI